MPKPTFDIQRPSQDQTYQADMDDRPSLATTRRKTVVKVNVLNIQPDFMQSRLILPDTIAGPYMSGAIDTHQAGKSYLELASDHDGVYRVVEELIKLGESIHTHGQIKPITGQFNSNIFILESGERRFWGTVLYHLTLGTNLDSVTLEALPSDHISRVRQIEENERNSSPNSITKARSISALILEYLNIKPDLKQFNSRHDYFRLANQKRIPIEAWNYVEQVMGLKRRICEYYLALLNLPDDVIEMLNIYDIPEKQIRPYTSYSPEKLVEIIGGLAQLNLDGEVATRRPDNQAQPEKQRVHHIIPSVKFASKLSREFHRINTNRSGYDLNNLAADLYASNGNNLNELIGSLKSLCDLLYSYQDKY